MDKDLNPQFLLQATQKIEETLERLLPLKPCDHQVLYEGARYALFSGGKRIRPLLTLATVDMLGGSVEAALVPACALELIHTYSLVHDDLPCMDDDDFRRGKPTVHKVYNEGIAVLIGDFLLTHAFEVLSKAPHLSADQRLSIIQTLSEASGGEGMVGGQVLDISLTDTPLENLHQKKTGALFKASLEFAGIICQAAEKEQKKLAELGANIGLLFQMVDDYIDQENDFSLDQIFDIQNHIKEILIDFSSQTHLTNLIQRIVDQIKATSSSS